MTNFITTRMAHGPVRLLDPAGQQASRPAVNGTVEPALGRHGVVWYSAPTASRQASPDGNARN